MRPRTEVEAAAKAQVPIGDYVPLGVHVAPDVVKLRTTAAYLATWRVDGITFETKDPDEILAKSRALNNLLLSLADGRWAVWTHKLRRKVHERLSTQYSNAFSSSMMQQYYGTFEKHQQMATELYLTLVFRPPTVRTRGIFRRSAINAQALRTQEEEALAVLDDAAKVVEATLREYGVTRLTTHQEGRHLISGPATLYGYLVNGVWEEVPLGRSELAELLPVSRLHFGDKNGMLELWHPTGSKFAGFLDIKEYPQDSEPGMCNALLYADYEYVETQSFTILHRTSALKALKDQQGHLVATEDVAESQIREMDLALDKVQAGAAAFGEYHYGLTVFGASPESVAKNVGEARGALSEVFMMAAVDAVPECAWFAQLPGNWRMRPREAKLMSDNFAALSPFHNFGSGKRDNNPWGEALLLLQTPNDQPYYFNFHSTPRDEDSLDAKAPGNTLIVGQTGSGKTATMGMMAGACTKYPGFRAVAFDLDRGQEIAIRAMGGRYVALTRGVPTGFNPFQIGDDQLVQSFCANLTRRLMCPPGSQPLTAKEDDAVLQAVHKVFTNLPPNQRRLASVDQLLPSSHGNLLRVRLKKWIGNESLGWVFDNPRDTQRFDEHQLFGYDYTHFLNDDEIRVPILMYLIFITDRLKDGNPFGRIVEEFWRSLHDEILSAETEAALKTDRKKLAIGIYATQSPSDVLQSKIGRTVIEQCVTHIYLPNTRAHYDDYVNGFKLTRAEFRLISNLGEHSREMLIKQGHHSARVRLDLSGLNDVLSVISGSEDNIHLLDALRAQLGDEPEDWLPEFYRKVAERREQKRAWSEARAHHREVTT